MLGSEQLLLPIVFFSNVQRENGEQIRSQPFLRARDEMNAHCAPLEMKSHIEGFLVVKPSRKDFSHGGEELNPSS
jgi:hypothetical protein